MQVMAFTPEEPSHPLTMHMPTTMPTQMHGQQPTDKPDAGQAWSIPELWEKGGRHPVESQDVGPHIPL
jgi:hypothetical protein